MHLLDITDQSRATSLHFNFLVLFLLPFLLLFLLLLGYNFINFRDLRRRFISSLDTFLKFIS